MIKSVCLLYCKTTYRKFARSVRRVKMASSADTSAALARLLNLNATDTDAFRDVFDAYFGERDDSEDDSSGDEDETGKLLKQTDL